MPQPQIVAIIQARMSSSRLPGKVLKEIAGVSMLEWVVKRANRASLLDSVVVATTTDPSDDPLAALCAEKGIPCYRGSLYDVLDRYYQAARHFQADIVIRLTADCPFIDPNVIDHTVREFLSAGVDFAANRLPPPWHRTYPIGLDVEVCSFTALERTWKEASEPFEREHVMPYLYDQEGRFSILLVDNDPDYGSYRWTVDTPEDLDLIRQVVQYFQNKDDFSWLDVLDLFQKHPELLKINAEVQHKLFNEFDQRRP